MPRPSIGITTDYNDRLTQYALPYGYSSSVEAAGGLPFLLPYRTDLSLIPEIVDRLDGILFSGGNDLDPRGYNQEPNPNIEPIDPLRERFERALLAEVEKRRLPTLGICLGSQLMNVSRGGSLHQFLPEIERDGSLEHRKLGDWNRRHQATLVPGTQVAERIGHRDVVVNTSHKQSVDKIGQGLRVIATAPDGVIEGIEDPTFPLFVGVQWHPERMSGEPDQLALFKLLVDKSRKP
ncbi:MAG: gamma-glutamyl-gamma-aminobutyrate hydrolase family protein [Phycisphaerae bacterium]|nr:gamma-glutamyl-gamma-aminobutyrate hydrolase family protein [Phycisphaerae bacterium]